MMFDNNGDSGDPCGTPVAVGWRLSPTNTPARRYLPINRNTALSRTFRATRAIKASWLTRSKNFARSMSTATLEPALM